MIVAVKWWWWWVWEVESGGGEAGVDNNDCWGGDDVGSKIILWIHYY